LPRCLGRSEARPTGLLAHPGDVQGCGGGVHSIRIKILLYNPLVSESASMLLVYFSVLNDNLIKRLISCIKCISMFQMKSTKYSLIHLLKYNHEAKGNVIHMNSQSTNSFIVKNLSNATSEYWISMETT
jgi:hypothetical protein